ncbi:hypothetical protein J437_LFUL012556 [Ladona fulva]|uniref:Receptor L-domain domain-containing protein n=1 Tax=Ladona fulva TaxID=123851 RepID=A0A8K0KC02_LADFU|nr:hypothetical protein J437_LFUL012556 [Ladona fulva]
MDVLASPVNPPAVHMLSSRGIKLAPVVGRSRTVEVFITVDSIFNPIFVNEGAISGSRDVIFSAPVTMATGVEKVPIGREISDVRCGTSEYTQCGTVWLPRTPNGDKFIDLHRIYLWVYYSKAELVGTMCQSVDIRNSVEHLERLRGCRVVEGFVQILLIDRASEENYTNISFPELREITGYLFLYRVNGLKTLEHLFPNLAVIRGHTLFYNYALVAFEVLSLQRIGLHSLTDILRGAVRFEKNPLLCFVHTIEWDLIAKNGKGEHYITVSTHLFLLNALDTCRDFCLDVGPRMLTGLTQ